MIAYKMKNIVIKQKTQEIVIKHKNAIQIYTKNAKISTM